MIKQSRQRGANGDRVEGEGEPPRLVSAEIAPSVDSSWPKKGAGSVLVLLILLLVVLFFGLGFTAHFLFFVAAVLFVLWLIGFVLGRGENAGHHHFYRW